MSQSNLSQFKMSLLASLLASVLVSLVSSRVEDLEWSPRRMCRQAPALLDGWAARTEQKLQLRADQERAWQDFVQAAHASFEPIVGLCRQEQANIETGDLPTKMTVQVKLASARLDALHALSPAVAQFWQELSPKQRKNLRGLRMPPLLVPADYSGS